MTTPYTLFMQAPNASPNVTMQAGRSGNSYTSDSYGFIHSVLPQDAVDLQTGGALMLGQQQSRNNFAGTAIPTVNDDISKDYGVGSRWLVPGVNKEYACFSAALGAASWAVLN